MYKPLAGCVCLAIPCVRPPWWETRPGYVQNDHQAYTHTDMLKPRLSSGGYNKIKETMKIIIHADVFLIYKIANNMFHSTQIF
jgi:hypothetical protein